MTILIIILVVIVVVVLVSPIILSGDISKEEENRGRIWEQSQK
jgi:hypothetical protein